MTNAEAWFNNSLRPRKPEGLFGRTAQGGHLDSHTAPELCLILPQAESQSEEEESWPLIFKNSRENTVAVKPDTHTL